ncbi:MAG: acyltransferase [Ferruginibacter sp.]
MQKSFHLKGLNGIRAIAALSVVFSHTMLGLNYFGLRSIEGGWKFANYGVTMFFTLSGFLITSLLMQEKEQFSTINIRDFYIRRILRIWPLYYLYIIFVVIVLYKYFPGQLPGGLAFYLFLAANMSAILNLTLPFLTHYWSLGVEEQFYLIWPWLFKKYSPLKAVTGFLIIFLLIKLLLRFFAPLSVGYQFISTTKFDCMAIGALAAILYSSYQKQVATFGFNYFTQIFSWAILIIAAAGYLNIPDFINHDIFSIATAIIIVNVAFNVKTIINLENRIFNFIGKISYGVYVYHVLLIFLLSKLFNNYLPFNNYTFQVIFIFIIVLSTTLLVSFVSYNFFEKKFLLLKKKFTKVASSA